VTERTIARRYVRALFELALETGDVGTVLHDLQALVAKLAQEPSALATLVDGRSDKPKKRAMLERLLADAKRPLTRDFASFLVDRGREHVLLIAAEELGAMGNEHRGEAIAEVVSATPLDAESRAALTVRLAELTRLKITLAERVDPALLGGVRVKVGSMLLDGSARRRLQNLRDDLLKVTLAPSAAS
jgi:F-type H+-transporting ATPase subunit delta